jgi:glycerol-3-phosphate dehydrogenase (NAD(P)+)
MRCAVVGAGAWGTALADLLAGNGCETILWAFEPDVATAINDDHENRRFLKGLPLNADLRATNDHRDALCDADLVVYAAPSDHLRRLAAAGAEHVPKDAILAVATKGIERGTLALMTTVIEQEAPGRAVVGISGPSFAAEVVAGHPTAIVAASANIDAAVAVQSALSS